MRYHPYLLNLFFWLGVILTLHASAQPQPVARFSFNDGNDYDEISGKKAKLINVSKVRDRFGNENSAVYIHGSNYTYVNLGSYKTLKPEQGSISLWMRLEAYDWSGRGAYLNPIILTKSIPGDDFYEAYAIYYNLYAKKLICVNSIDSMTQAQVYSRELFTSNKWDHLVMIYSDTLLSFYINGKLEGKVAKHFPTHFLANDSVMLGHTANVKNERYFVGKIDDVEIFDHPLSSEEVLELYEAPNPNRYMALLRWLLIGCAVAIFFLLLYLYTKHRIRLAVARENDRLEQINRSLENELRVHRAMMNPHFIFNTLNGLQDFILKKEFDGANDYLIRFSILLRKILESNLSDTISLELEIELLQRYVEMESLRFEENIDFNLSMDPAIVPSVTYIPIMMLQPFIENAIWHGLLTKPGHKTILLDFRLHEEKYLRCTIEDNGVGRSKKGHLQKKKSLAIQFIRQRLNLLNKIHKFNCSLEIEDKEKKSGTQVIIILPIMHG